MLTPLVRYLARHLFFLIIVIFIFFFYPWITFGFFQGTLIGLLTWSLYVLSFPAAHGYYIFGSFARFIGITPLQSEPFMLTAAVILNIIMVVIARPLYQSTFFTIHLFRIISKPNPYWLMIAVSALGTLYYYLVGEHQVREYYRYHRTVRWILVFLGVCSFFYFSWYDLVILLNDRV